MKVWIPLIINDNTFSHHLNLEWPNVMNYLGSILRKKKITGTFFMRESNNNRASKMEGNCLFDDSHSQSFFLLYSSELRVKDWFLRGWKKWSLSDKIHLSGSKNLLLKNDVQLTRLMFLKLLSNQSFKKLFRNNFHCHGPQKNARIEAHI